MSNRPKKAPPASVAALLNQITEWREHRHRPKRKAMPEELWSEATRLGVEYGVSSVSRHLKLDYHGLKRRVLGESEAAIMSGNGFVELGSMDIQAGSPSGICFETEMEIYRRGEVTVRVRQRGPAGIDIVGIVESCLRKH